MSKFVQRGGLWVIVQFVLIGALVLTGLYFPGAGGSTMSTVLGIIILAVGGIVALASSLSLGRSLTPCLQPLDEAKFVRSGIYGFLRHPIYASLMAAGFGWALVRHSWPAFGMAMVLALFFDAKARREEQWLRTSFPDYREYARNVRRFIPWVY